MTRENLAMMEKYYTEFIGCPGCDKCTNYGEGENGESEEIEWINDDQKLLIQNKDDLV